MSIQSEITRINTNIASAYNAVQTMGGTLPATQNSANLAAAIATLAPPMYTQLDYLYSPGSGAAYIDTGVTGGTKVGYELKIKITTVSRTYARYFGGNDLPEYPVPVSNQNGTGNKAITIGSYRNSTLTNYKTFYPSSSWHIIYVMDGVVKFDGTQATTSAINTGWNTTSCRLFGTSWTGGSGACYIEYCKMYTDGVLVRDYIPAKRNSDGVLGMYDQLNDQFYTNGGSGSFSYGSEVGPIPGKIDVPSPSSSSGSIANQILRINENIANAYDVCAQIGRTMPSYMNSENLEPTILNTPGYEIRFENYDGTLLDSGIFFYGEMPIYSGTTPRKPPDATYVYTFNSWSPILAPVTAATTYTATFTSTAWSPVITNYEYTGDCTEDDIRVGGTDYKLLKLTSDGTLTFNGPVLVDIWACGGGSRGLRGTDITEYTGAGPGGGGGYCREEDGVYITSIDVKIGPANDSTGTIITGDASLDAAGSNSSRNGGSGGGGSWVRRSEFHGTNTRAVGGNGDGQSKYPFGDTVNFEPHCAGGAGGTFSLGFGMDHYSGGSGGSNGSNGGDAPTDEGTILPPGGSKGGGRPGQDATFYGGGGGGSSVEKQGPDYLYVGPYGNGYQGVCYVRYIPITGYDVNWKNYDNTLLESDKYIYGDTPTYDGPLPVREPDTERYIFTGWTPTVAPVTANQNYTAIYSTSSSDFTITYSGLTTPGSVSKERSNYIKVGNTYNNLSSGTMTSSLGDTVTFHLVTFGGGMINHAGIYFNGTQVAYQNSVGYRDAVAEYTIDELWADITVTVTHYGNGDVRMDINYI